MYNSITMKKYNCKCCKYETDNLYNYRKHLETLKHRHNITQTNSDNNARNIYTICQYCKKKSYKKHIKRHYNICKVKRNIDINNNNKLIMKNLMKVKKNAKKKDNKIKKMRREKKALKREKKELEKQFLELMKTITLKSAKSTMTTNTYNMYYIINNFKDAYDFNEMMNIPLTESERDELYKLGPNHGCLRYIKNRCIDGISVEKRPIHCVDSARNKYLLRQNNDWIIDDNGKLLIKEAYEKIKNVYLVKLNNMDAQNIEELNTKMKQLLTIESKGKIKILGMLNNMVLLKNTIHTSY